MVAALAIPLQRYLEAFSDADAFGDLLRPNTLSVGVRRDMIFRSRLVTATTRTGKPRITFCLSTTAGSGKWRPSTAYALAGLHTERRRVPMRRWFEKRLAMLLAACYVAAMARGMTAVPHDELT